MAAAIRRVGKGAASAVPTPVGQLRRIGRAFRGIDNHVGTPPRGFAHPTLLAEAWWVGSVAAFANRETLDG